MARLHDSKEYDLSDAEKRDLIKLIMQGKPLPEQCYVFLFEERREVELVWSGKTREICTAVRFFQTLEHINEPLTELPHPSESRPRIAVRHAPLRQARPLYHRCQRFGNDTMTLVPVTVG